VLLAEKLTEDENARQDKQKGAREWLKSSLKVYEILEYEDERLRDHAMELVEALNKELGIEEEGDGEAGWQDESDEGEAAEDLEATDGDGDAEMS